MLFSTARLPKHVETDAQLWQAFRYHSRTFSFAARLLPRELQLPVATLYQFCRSVDTIADERVLEVGADVALSELYTLRAKLDTTLDGRPPRQFVWQRLAGVIDRLAFDPRPLYELIDGAEWDLRGRPITTYDDLVAYSNLVGGSIGAMMLPFLTHQPDAPDDLDEPARALGIAMQITNILRDVGEDFRKRDRVYLPGQELDALGLDLSALLHDGPSPSYRSIVEVLMGTAETYYDRGLPAIDRLPRVMHRGIRSAARSYREILNELRAVGYDNLSRRVYVPFWRKCWLVVHDGYEARRARLRHAIAAPVTA